MTEEEMNYIIDCGRCDVCGHLSIIHFEMDSADICPICNGKCSPFSVNKLSLGA